MTDWRIRQRYGFGAGQLRLSPHISSLAKRTATTRAGLYQAGRELHQRSWSRTLRSATTVVVSIALAIAFLSSLTANYLADPVEETDLQVVEFETPVEMEAPAPETAAIPIAVAEASPASEPTPAPERQILSMPQIPEIAMAAPSEPLRRATRPEAPATRERPVVTIDAVAHVAEPVAEAQTRLSRPVKERPRPRVMPLAQIDAVTSAEVPVATTAPRVSRSASKHLPQSVQPIVRIDPVAKPEPTQTPQLASGRLSKPRPQQAAATKRAPASLAPVEIAAANKAGVSGTRLPVAIRTAPRRERAAVYTAQPAALRGNGPGAVAASHARFDMPSTSTRNQQVVVADNRSFAGERDASLEGVPLSALAACVSDREEDALKLDLIELVSRPRECVSAAGRYRFVETKNLNAFLMWIERSAQRQQADRCIELRLALDCLQLEGEYGGST